MPRHDDKTNCIPALIHMGIFLTYTYLFVSFTRKTCLGFPQADLKSKNYSAASVADASSAGAFSASAAAFAAASAAAFSSAIFANLSALSLIFI